MGNHKTRLLNVSLNDHTTNDSSRSFHNENSKRQNDSHAKISQVLDSIDFVCNQLPSCKELFSVSLVSLIRD